MLPLTLTPTLHLGVIHLGAMHTPMDSYGVGTHPLLHIWQVPDDRRLVAALPAHWRRPRSRHGTRCVPCHLLSLTLTVSLTLTLSLTHPKPNSKPDPEPTS